MELILLILFLFNFMKDILMFYKFEREKQYFRHILMKFLNKVKTGFYINFSVVKD